MAGGAPRPSGGGRAPPPRGPPPGPGRPPGSPARVRSDPRVAGAVPNRLRRRAPGARSVRLPGSVPSGGLVDSKEEMMASEQQLERSMLDGKDREELHAIAGAMGVKGITRLRKADLVDAILAAAAGQGGGGNGAKAKGNGAPKKRAVRSKKASELSGAGDLAA